MNKYLLKNKKTGTIECPVYDFDQDVIWLLEVVNNKVLSGSIGMYHDTESLYKEWTHIEGD